MASIYFIRHGQAAFGEDNYDKLSALGKVQARLTGEYLCKTDVKFDAVYSGSLLRQRETCEQVRKKYKGSIYQFPKTIIDERLNELQAENLVTHLAARLTVTTGNIEGDMDNARYDNKGYQKLLHSCFKYWLVQDEEVDNCVRDIMALHGSGKNIAVFTSGGVIAAVVKKSLDLPGSDNYPVFEPVINASITHCNYSQERYSLNYYNDHSFLRLMGGEKVITSY